MCRDLARVSPQLQYVPKKTTEGPYDHQSPAVGSYRRRHNVCQGNVEEGRTRPRDAEEQRAQSIFANADINQKNASDEGKCRLLSPRPRKPADESSVTN